MNEIDNRMQSAANAVIQLQLRLERKEGRKEWMYLLQLIWLAWRGITWWQARNWK